MEYLKKETYKTNATENEGVHWNSWKRRWLYFEKAIEYAKEVGVSDAKKVLEIGTMGAPIVTFCDTMDFADESTGVWDFKNKKPTYCHDARNTPWPIEDKKYDLFIALRVFQHLIPSQQDCFNEVRRISKNAIIVVPEKYKNGGGITLDHFLSWNNNSPPKRYERVYNKDNYIYLWEF